MCGSRKCGSRSILPCGHLTTAQERATVKANPAPAVFIAEALELCLAKGYRVPQSLADGFCRLTLDAIGYRSFRRAR